MNSKDNPSKSKNNLTSPFTIWDDLAQTNVLIEYVRRFDDSNLNTSDSLHSTILNSIYNYSTEVAVEVEAYYCKQYYSCLKKFLDRTQTCRQALAKQSAQK